MSSPFRVFVTGTDTGVGKTETSCALLSLLAKGGLHPAPMKPYESGCARLTEPADALRLRAAAKSDDPLEQICPHRFRLPLAPGVAAEKEKRPADFKKTLAAFRAFGDTRPMVVEGAGGLFVPLDGKRDVIDLIVRLKLPVLLVARAGLGTLNHTALSLEALARRDVPVLAVLLSRSTEGRGDASEKDNARLIAQRHKVKVLGPVPYVADPRRRQAAFERALRGYGSQAAV